MADELKSLADAILKSATSGDNRVPAVVAMITNRDDNIYMGAEGLRCSSSNDLVKTDDVFALFSTTKAITATALLQLVERGQVDLETPAAEYIPEIATLQVLEGFSDSGEPIFRPPRQAITPRMLLLHTAGFGYDFFDPHYFRLAEEHEQPSVITATRESLMTPLLFDPGEKWNYGSNLDWCGQIVEAVAGKRLGQVFDEEIFQPLGITSMTFEIDDEVRSRLVQMHARNPEDASLEPLEFELPEDPQIHMGGHGLYGNIEDYMRFIRMWLNNGKGEHGEVLSAETVLMASTNQLGQLKVNPLFSTNPAYSNDAEFFPGQDKSWAFSFMVNDEQTPTGRPAGSLGWAGLANLFYWIDQENGFGGFWASQILPFGDAGSFSCYLDFETAFYQWCTASN